MNWRAHKVIGCLLLAAAALSAHAPALESTFHLDDLRTILQDPRVQDPSRPLDVLKSNPARFLLHYSFALSYRLAGSNEAGIDPFGFLLVNLVLHMLNCVLVFLLLERLLSGLSASAPERGPNSDGVSILFPAFFSGLIMAVHPIHTQSVAYISNRSGLMCSTFFLLACLLFPAAGVRTRRPGIRTLCSLLVFLAALLTKQIAATLPAVLLLRDLLYSWNGDNTSIRWRRHLPFWSLLAVGLAAIYGLQGSLGNPASSLIRTTGVQILTETWVVILYVGKLLFPVDLNFDPDIREVLSVTDKRFLLGMVVTVTLCGLIYALRRKTPAISFALSWFLITLVPTTSFIVLSDLMAEHRLYLPSVGFFLAMSWTLTFLLRRAFRKRVRPVAALILAASVALSGVPASRARNRDYRDPNILWENAARGSPGKSRPFYHLGLLAVSRAEAEPHHWDQAIQFFERSLENTSTPLHSAKDIEVYYHTLVSLAGAQIRKSRTGVSVDVRDDLWSRAEVLLSRAIADQPRNRMAFYNLIVLYRERMLPGEIMFAMETRANSGGGTGYELFFLGEYFARWADSLSTEEPEKLQLYKLSERAYQLFLSGRMKPPSESTESDRQLATRALQSVQKVIRTIEPGSPSP